MLRLLIVSAVLALAACGSDTPVPEYPFPAQVPLEETDLAQSVGGAEDVDEEEEWDAGLSDEDLEMDSSESSESSESETPPAEPAAEAAEGEEGSS